MWSDFMAGSTDIGVGSTAPTSPVLQTGRGKLIASVGTRNRAFPDAPTLAEQGLKSQASHIRGYVGLWAPAHTPDNILERLSEAVVLGGKDSRVQQATEQFHLDPAVSTAEAKKRFAADSVALIAALKQLGIQPE